MVQRFVCVGLIGALIGALVATSPKAVVPRFVPEDSPIRSIPPWPVFRLGTFVNDLLTRLSVATTPPEVRALQLTTMQIESMIVYALTEHQLLGKLPAACEDACAGANLEFCCRFMRAGAGIGVLQKTGDDPAVFSLTAVGQALNGDIGKFANIVLNRENRDALASAAEKSVLTGKSGFYEHYGEELWEWFSRNQQSREDFDVLMRVVTIPQAAALLSSLSLIGNETVCDIGGGVGALLGLFSTHWPEINPILFDLEGPSSRAGNMFSEKQTKATVLTGSFFDPLPKELSKCDVVFLKSVLHDWSDDECIKILRNIKTIIDQPGRKKAKLVVFESVIGVDPDGGSMEKTKLLLDIVMLSHNSQGARERTLAEYKYLLREGGFETEDDSTFQLLKTRSPLTALVTSLA